MATTKTASTIAAPFDIDFDANAERVRELNDKVVTAAKQAGAVSLDTYEQTVNTMLDFGQKAADSPSFWCQHVTKVASEALVPKAAPNVLMPGDEPALPSGVVEERGLLAKPVQDRVRICQKLEIRGVELHRFAQCQGLTIGRRLPS